MKTLKNIEKYEDKRVFIRTDYNVPMNDEGEITDDFRIRKTIPTLEYLLEKGSRIILGSHLGRPGGERIEKLSLEVVAARLAELFNAEITFFPEVKGMGVHQMVRDLKPGSILFLENLRFYPEEKKNSVSFAKELASLCDIYVNDAFGVSHRKHASVNALPRQIDRCAGGLLMQEELQHLKSLTSFNHGDGFCAIIGGSKVSGKIDVVRNLLDVVDVLLIGGAMAYTFIKAQGIEIGKSPVENDKIHIAKNILKGAKARNVKIVLPVDHVTAESADSEQIEVHENADFPADQYGFDIGPQTVQKFSEAISRAEHVFWNGPLGLFEKPQFEKGSISIAKVIADSDAEKVAGGGDSIALIKKAGVESQFNHISTGGGATLEFIKSGTLPAIEVLRS
ncbi:MAG: phosphoglycerate kinase [bacterium]